MNNFVLKLFIGFLVCGVIITTYYNQKIEINELKNYNSTLESVNKTNISTIVNLKKDIKDITEENKKLNEKYKSIKSESDKIKNLTIKHDLNYLFQNKPKMIIKRINNGVKVYNKQLNEIMEGNNG